MHWSESLSPEKIERMLGSVNYNSDGGYVTYNKLELLLLTSKEHRNHF